MSLFCYTVICVHCSFAIILLGKKELVVLFNCLLDIMLLLLFFFLFLAALWVGLQGFNMAFSGHIYLLLAY